MSMNNFLWHHNILEKKWNINVLVVMTKAFYQRLTSVHASVIFQNKGLSTGQ